jgi:hypothetical protein
LNWFAQVDSGSHSNAMTSMVEAIFKSDCFYNLARFPATGKIPLKEALLTAPQSSQPALARPEHLTLEFALSIHFG